MMVNTVPLRLLDCLGLLPGVVFGLVACDLAGAAREAVETVEEEGGKEEEVVEEEAPPHPSPKEEGVINYRDTPRILRTRNR